MMLEVLRLIQVCHIIFNCMTVECGKFCIGSLLSYSNYLKMSTVEGCTSVNALHVKCTLCPLLWVAITAVHCVWPLVMNYGG